MQNAKGKVSLILLIVALVASCGPVTPYPTPTVPVSTKPVSVPTATLTPVVSMIELYKPTNVYDPKDPSLPDLIVPSDNGLRLDPEWQVAKIEYVYDWWGLAEPTLGYEIIEKKNSEYYWGNQKIEQEAIRRFVNVITNLYSSQSLLVGIWHTDDYPTWKVELTGTDGNRVLLYAASNENIGSAPWHVIYNGRIYAQYDGSLAIAIEQLFAGAGPSPNRDVNWSAEWHDPNLVGFQTTGWTNQFWYGFNGLLPISEHFHYYNDLENDEINGYVRGRYSIAGLGHMIVGNIASLRSVKIKLGNQSQNCDIINVESEDVYSSEWTFRCKVPHGELGQRYRYPIQVELGTDSGQNFITEGELYGVWQSLPSYWDIPLADEIEAAIDADPNVKALIENNTLPIARYVGKFRLGQDASPVLEGQIILIGDMELDGTKVRYSVSTPFIVENRRFTRFGLTEQELEVFISEVMRSPVTRRVLVYNPNVMLNLWYAEIYEAPLPEMPNLWGRIPGAFSQTQVDACGNTPIRVYPSDKVPFRMFAFNYDYLWYPWDGGGNIVAFTFTESGEVIIDEIDLWFWGNEVNSTGLDRIWQLLLPSQLNMLGMRPFAHIGYSSENQRLMVSPSYQATNDEIQAYKKSLALLPVSIENEIKWYFANDISFSVVDDGSIMAIPCVK